MTTSTVRALVCATAVAVAVVGCAAPAPEPASQPEPTTTAEQQDRADQADEPDPEVAPACTLIGNAEGVSVDLADVLDLEGGDYFAEVSVPAAGASNVRGFAGNDEYYPSGDVAVDLDGEPTLVEVVVRDEGDQVVYTASGSPTPTLYQPNGARCDGENYTLSLLATPAGGLEQLPWPPQGALLDARGRESVVLFTACGVDRVQLDETGYTRVGGVLGGPDGPPPGWNSPYQRGWATRSGDEVVYTDDAGHRETFRRDQTFSSPASCT